MKTCCNCEGDLFVKRQALQSDMEGTCIILMFAMERIVGRVTSSRRVRGSLHASGTCKSPRIIQRLSSFVYEVI